MRKIEVKRGKKFIKTSAAMNYRLLSTGKEKRIIMNLGALSGYVKSVDSHPNAEVFLLEVPHGYVSQTKDFVKRHLSNKENS